MYSSAISTVGLLVLKGYVSFSFVNDYLMRGLHVTLTIQQNGIFILYLGNNVVEEHHSRVYYLEAKKAGLHPYTYPGFR